MRLKLLLKTWLSIACLISGFGISNSLGAETPDDYNPYTGKRFLVDALEELSETYQVIFSFDAELLEGITVDFEIQSEENLEVAINRLLVNTGLRYKFLGSKYYVIYKDDRKGTRVLKKLERKFQQIQQIEEKGNIDVRKAVKNGDQRIRAIQHTVRQLKAADQTITGTVRSEDGGPLVGATIRAKDYNIGALTDDEGKFQITVPDEVTSLLFSYIGYETQEVEIRGRTSIDIVLLESGATLDEVVVTALGIEKDKKTLGYATSKVDPNEVTVNRQPKFMDALQGKVAGVNITSLGSGPQGSSKIRIRGVSSFGANNSPLIVVNGVPIDNSNRGVSRDRNVGGVPSGYNWRTDTGDGLSSINPDDIVSINVLKGAAASALYGSRGKDGVIIITTKTRADGSGLQVQLNSNYTWGVPLDFTDFQYEYGQGEGGARPNAPGPTSGVWSFGEKIDGGTQILFDGLVVPYEAQPNKVRDYYRDSRQWTNTLSIASGGQNGGFNLSVSNMDTEAILPGSSYDRRTINFGFTQNARKFSISGNINYSNEFRKNPPNVQQQDFSPVVIYTLATTMPLDVLRDNAFDEDGNEIKYSRFTNRTNPYFSLSRFENNQRDRVYGNITARYNFTDWLYLQVRIGQDYFTQDVDYNLPSGRQRDPAAPPGFVNGQFVTDITRFREINADFLIGANQSFGDISINITAGGNQMYRELDRNIEVGELFFTRNLYSIGNASKVTPTYIISERQVNSLYGAAEISYKGWFFVNATARNDWFSTLSPENRSILYPSVTGSFVFSDAFNLPEWLNFGKIRLAYAEVGSDTDVAPYSNNLFYGISSQQFPNSNGTPQPLGNISGSTVPNANLKPMRVTEQEIGLELILFKHIRFEASYYSKLSSDQILTAQISNASGFTSQLINVGESRNRGVEMLLSFSPVKTRTFEWNVSANGTYNTSMVLSLGDDVDGTFIRVGQAEFHGELRQVVGQPMAQLYGWGYLRDDQGRQIFDPNSGRPMRSTEQLNFGTALPKWWGGIINGFTYKNLNFSFLIDFKLGHKMISGTHTNAYRHGLDKATLEGREQGFVVGDGVNPNGETNTVQTPVQRFYETIRSFRGSEQSVFDAGSWQLRQMNLGYQFNIPSNKYISGLQISLVANNVAVLKKWVPHIHPDQNALIGDTEAGLEATGLPVTRDIGVNLNLKF